MPLLNSSRFACLSLLALAGTLFFPGCSRKEAQARTEKLGTSVAVGSLTYTAVETEWREALDTDTGQRTPKNRFLLIHVSVSNTAGEEKAAPLLQLVDAKGEFYPELSEGQGVPEWLGLLRLLQANESRSGRIVFDVPQGAYKLRLSSGGDPENEQFAFVEIPLQLNPDTTHISGTPTATGVDEPAKK
jgi:hypothetical protein